MVVVYFVFVVFLDVGLFRGAAEIVFTSQPRDAIVLSDQSVCFGCDYSGTTALPKWNITGMVYFITSLPLIYSYTESSGLCIENALLSMNNTYYACNLYGGPVSSTGHLTVIGTIDDINIHLEPENIVTVHEGNSVYFQCEFYGTTFHPNWKINDEFYSTSDELSLPPNHHYQAATSTSILTVENVDLTLNNSQYSCGFTLYHGEMIQSPKTILLVTIDTMPSSTLERAIKSTVVSQLYSHTPDTTATALHQAAFSDMAFLPGTSHIGHGSYTSPTPTVNTTETHNIRAILLGTIGAGVIFVILILISGASLIILLVHVCQARSCNEHKDTGPTYETVIESPAPVRCQMSENQAYGVPRKAMLEEGKALELSNQHSTEDAKTIGSNFPKEAYKTVAENVYDTIKD